MEVKGDKDVKNHTQGHCIRFMLLNHVAETASKTFVFNSFVFFNFLNNYLS